MSRKLVPFKMPVRSVHGVPLQSLMSLEAAGIAPPRSQQDGQHSSSSALDQWVQCGRVTDQGSATFSRRLDHAREHARQSRANNTLEPDEKAGTRPSSIDRARALHDALDRICSQQTKNDARTKRHRRPIAANDAPSRLAPIADIAGRQPASPTDTTRPEKPTPASTIDASTIEIEQLSKNVVRLFEQGGKAIAACLKPHEESLVDGVGAGEVIGVARTFGHVAEYWFAHPHRAIEVQANLGKAYVGLWTAAVKRMLGAPAVPVATCDPKDRRFANPEWSSNPHLDFLKQAYLLTSHWAHRFIADSKGVDAHTRRKAELYMRQFTEALSPTNFVLTNPELLRETMSSNAGNLVHGMRMLVEDIERGRGRLKIRQSDLAAFEVGRNLAITPGKVIYQNELMQLIQYMPSTGTVLKRPILVVPPWINKYYILDLAPEKSFVKWCVDQGLTVFVISWVNPDAKLAGKGFDDYMREGPLEAVDVITKVTSEEKVHTVGYCAGGTLLAVMLAYMAAKSDARALSATLFTTQVDFTYAGEIMAFIDEEQIEALERRMSATGFLQGHQMASAFNLLRSNDLVWPYVINNYLKGKAPRPFDLLHWNSDATRIPVAMHSFYLRNCYLENKLAKGEMVIAGETIDLGNVTIPIYSLATRDDHIAPARSVFLGSKFFGGPIKFVVAGSGHIAGVVNPPHEIKYSHWTDGPTVSNIDTWLAKAREHPGSWWPHWLQWIRKQDPTEVAARCAGGGKLEPLEDAPGSYVKVRN